MELADFIKILTLIGGFTVFVLLLAWVFEGTTEEGKGRIAPRLGRRKKV